MPWSPPCWTSAVAAGGRRPSRSRSATAATRWFRRLPVWLGRRFARGADEAPTDRIRRPGGGRPRIQQDQPGIQAALQALVDPLTRGDPTSPLRWTCKSRAKLAAALTEQRWRVSSTTVGRLLHRLGYRLQSARKRQEGATHPDRNAQFEHINQTADEHLAAGQPVVSVDKKTSGETAHLLRDADRHAQADAGFGLDRIGEGRRKRVAMLDAELGDLAGKPPGRSPWFRRRYAPRRQDRERRRS